MGVEGRQSWEQICRRHQGEWVLLVDVEWVDDSSFDARSAVVVAHSKERSETLARVEDLPKPVDFTHFFVVDFDVPK